MANEYLQRTPTSTGNRRVFTWSTWVKRNSLTSTNQNLLCSTEPGLISKLFFNTNDKLNYQNNSPSFELITSQTFRDAGNWFHILFVAETTASISSERIKIYVNGARITKFDTETYPAINSTLIFNYPIGHFISRETSTTNWFIGEFADIFFVDGQALTPDVFGFYKQGKGYISVGSTQATDFRPGQWVPKTPRVIKTEINRRGGFGVNGFYLPMNDSNNFGADFHCTPNSIIKLQENLPQPRCRIDGVGDYTGALRDDPFKQYLIYSQPNVLGGLQNGYGDYSHIIRSSGSPKVITGGASGTPTISTTQSLYYGSSLYFDGNDTINVETGDSNYLGGDFTIEFWVWHDSAYPINQMAFNTVPHTSFGISLNRGGSGQTALYVGNGSSWQLTDFRSGGRLYSQQWNHVAVERYNNTITIYHNGVAQASYKQGDQVVTNSGTFTGVMPTGFSSSLRYGTYENTSGEPILGYIQDYRIYSGVAKYTGGFDVPRPYTPVGIATWRAVPDCTANNFATMNPLIGATPRSGGTVTSTIVTYTDGNLTTRNSANAGYAPAMQSHSNVGMTTGKWYWEASNLSTTGNEYFGISKGNEIVTPNGVGTGIECLIAYLGSNGDLYLSLQYDGTARTSATLNNSPGIGISSTSDVIGFAFDVTNSSLSVYLNGVLNNTATGIVATSNVREWFVTKSANSSSSPSGMSWNFGQNPTFSGNTTAGTFTDSNSKGLFKYQPPSGFLALCEDNLPTPAISNPGQYFRTVLYTGTGASRNIVGVGFTPDLVWIKERNGADNHRLVDSVRGPIRELYSSLTNAEAIDSGGVLSFDSDGFSLGNGNSYNESGINHVAWCWRAGAGTTSTNTNGSITSVVSVNQDAGFSIVSWTGNGVEGATIGHGLNKAPKFIVQKNRDGGSAAWRIWHSYLGDTYGLNSGPIFITFDTGPATYDSQRITGSTATTFRTTGTVTPYSNSSGTKFITYCWTEIEGFSKAFSYVGNGSADGPLIYLNFKPALIIIKRTNDVGNWQIYDSSRMSTNPNNGVLFPNLSNIEGVGSAYDIDFLSNGFKLRSTDTDRNASGSTYVGFAWAESPFQTANSK